MARDIKILLPTTGIYFWELKPFFEMFNRFWGEDQEVRVLTERDPGLGAYPNARFVQMPDRYINDAGIWTGGAVTAGMRWYLKDVIGEEPVVILQTDYWLTGPVDVETIHTVLDFMEERDDVVRVALCVVNAPVRHQVEFFAEHDGVEFLRCPADDVDCFLLLGNYPAAWKPGLVRQIWEDEWGLWTCEQVGSHKLMTKFPEWKSLMVKRWPLQWRSAAATRLGWVRLHRLPPELATIVERYIPSDLQVIR